MVHPLRFTTMHAHGSRTLASPGRKDKDARKAGHRLYPNFTPVTEGRSMKDACGCLVLQSFNTTRRVRAGRQHEKRKQETECTGKSIGRKREARNKRQSAREGRRGREYFRMIGIVGDVREMRSAVGWNRLYSNGVAIRVMLEYIDYWGDQRVGDDGMTPVLNSREEDEGSKQLVLPLLPPVSPHSRPLFSPVRPFVFRSRLEYPTTSSADFRRFTCPVMLRDLVMELQSSIIDRSTCVRRNTNTVTSMCSFQLKG